MPSLMSTYWSPLGRVTTWPVKASLGNLATMKRFAEQMDQVLIRLTESLGRVERAAGQRTQDAASGSPQVKPAEGAKP